MPAQKSDKRERRRGGFYWLDLGNGQEEPFVSVTTVLGVIDKPALRYWYAKEVWTAMVANPSLSDKEAMNAPFKSSKKSMERGSVVHGIAEQWKKDDVTVDFDSLPEDIRGYGKALESWAKDVRPVPLANEKSVISHKYGYAGTLDMLAEIGGEPAVIDFKTNKKGEVYDEAHIQIAAYLQALQEAGEDVKKGYVIGLSEKGKYKMVEVEANLDIFLAAKMLWEFKNRDLIDKVGYTNLLSNRR